MFAFVFRLQTDVAFQIVPDEDDRATKILVQFVEHVRHLGGLRAAWQRCGKEFHVVADRRDRHESDGRKMGTFVRLDDDVRQADGRPASQEKRHKRKPGFIDKYDMPAVVTRFFLYEATCNEANVRRLGVNIFSTA